MASGNPGSDKQAVHMVSGLFLGALFTLPLLANAATQTFGLYIFFLADPRLQFFWGSVVQFTAGGPFYAGLLRRPYDRVSAWDLSLAVSSTAAYGYSVFHTFGRDSSVAVHQPLLLYTPTAAGLVLGLAIRLYWLGRRGPEISERPRE